jgi:hypothetical protein
MTSNRPSKAKQRLAAAGIAVGATLGSFAAASALSSTDDTATVIGDQEATDDQGSAEPSMEDLGDGGTKVAEEPLTGDLATQVTAAAEAAVPGGTVRRVETDAHGAAYEAHMTDADGNPVTVTFDENLDLVETITGPRSGHGGRRHHDPLDEDETESTDSDDTGGDEDDTESTDSDDTGGGTDGTDTGSTEANGN